MRGFIRALEPLPCGGGEDALRIRGKRGEQAPSALGVEFTEDVVEQVDRRGAAARADQFGLGEPQGQRERALLALAGERRGGGSVQFEENVIAVRTDHGLAQASLFHGACLQRGREVLPSGTLIAQTAGFATRADGRHMPGHQGRQFGAEFLPRAAEVLSGGKKRSVVSRDFASAVRTLFEEEVARAQGAFVGAEIFQVARVALAAQKVEEAAAFRRRAADQFDVFVRKKGDQSGAEVFVGFALGQIIEKKFAALDFGKMTGHLPFPGATGQ